MSATEAAVLDKDGHCAAHVNYGYHDELEIRRRLRCGRAGNMDNVLDIFKAETHRTRRRIESEDVYERKLAEDLLEEVDIKTA